MNQISLKTLKYDYSIYTKTIRNIPFASFPGAVDCLKDLLEFECDTNIHPECLDRLSRICFNIQTLSIKLYGNVSKELKRLICSQNRLKNLDLMVSQNYLSEIIPVLTRHHYNTLTRLQIDFQIKDVTLSFISSFINLEELVISSLHPICRDLQHMILPKLQVFKILNHIYDSSTSEILIEFLENNGDHLVDLYLSHNNKSLNLSIIQNCSNLKKLFVTIPKGELDILINLFDNCQLLEILEIRCDGDFINEKDMLEVVAKYSLENFYRLRILNNEKSKLLPEELESFFMSWGKRIPLKPLTLIKDLETNKEKINIIEKYKKLGIIKVEKR